MSRLLVVSLLLVLLLCAAPAVAQEQASPTGLFFESSFWVSTFVTDKGGLEREASAAGERRNLDVHTGELNLIFVPSLALGWGWGDWEASIRASYLIQLARLDLPNGETAEGSIQSLELGPDFSYHLFDFAWTSVEAQFGGAVRFFGRGELEYHLSDGPGPDDARSFVSDTALAGYALHLGAGGDLMQGEHVLLGWLMRFYWGGWELYSDSHVTYERPSRITYDEERLFLNVYSVFFGLRLRIFPYTVHRELQR